MSRDRLDRYYTPQALADACVRRLAKRHWMEGKIWEPHCGGGAFVRAAQHRFEFCERSEVYAGDISPDAEGLALVGEDRRNVGPFLAAERWVDWTIGNPPFNDCPAHVRRAIESSRRGVAFLLPLNFLEPCDGTEKSQRLDLLPGGEHPFEVAYPVKGRVKWEGYNPHGNSPKLNVCLFVWLSDRPGAGRIGAPIVWKRPADALAAAK